jgi:hypothetical protein
MKVLWFIFIVHVSILVPSAGTCELEGHAFMDPSIQGIRTYQRPKLLPPSGWVENDAAGQEIRGVFFVMAGKNPSNSEVTIYALAVQKENPSQVISSFVEDDITNFKNNSDKGSVSKIDSLRTASGKLPSYSFMYKNEGHWYIQTVAYGEEGKYFLSFVLTAKSKPAHDRTFPVFKQLLSTYE